MEENTVGQTVRRFSQMPEVTEPLCHLPAGKRWRCSWSVSLFAYHPVSWILRDGKAGV